MYIGILLRKQLCDDKFKYTLNNELFNTIETNGFIPIGIKNIKSIKLCKGIILQGGEDFDDEDISFVKYLYENDIPTLGICLGMQMMSMVNNGQVIAIENNHHQSKNKYVHYININNKSKLYQILKQDRIRVNSRHKDHVIKTNLEISSYSDDNIIESLEDKNKKFFIGVQWHPESNKDDLSYKLFDAFFKSCQ